MLEEILKDLTAAIREQTEVLKICSYRTVTIVNDALTNEEPAVQNLTEQVAAARKGVVKAQPKKPEPTPVVVTEPQEKAVEPSGNTPEVVANEDFDAVRQEVRELATSIITKAVGEDVRLNKARVKEIAGELGASESTIATVPEDRIVEFRDILKSEFAEHLAANGK